LKFEVSAAVLLSIAVILLQYAVRLLEAGNYQYGVPLAVAGVILIVVTLLLVREGVISYLRRVDHALG